MSGFARWIGRGAAAVRGLLSHSSRCLPAGVLLCCTFVDELLAGIPVVGLPLIRDGLSLSYGQAGLLLSIGGLVGMVTEPLLFAHTDRRPRHRVALWATVGLAGLMSLSRSVSTPYGGIRFSGASDIFEQAASLLLVAAGAWVRGSFHAREIRYRFRLG